MLASLITCCEVTGVVSLLLAMFRNAVQAKCMRYWPDAESTQQYGNLTVTVDDVSDHPDYLLTTMAVYNSEVLISCTSLLCYDMY